MYSAILTNTFYNYDKYITVDWCVCILIIDKIRGTAAKTCPLLPLRMIGMGGGEAWRGLLKHDNFFDKSLDGLNELFAFCICKKGRLRK